MRKSKLLLSLLLSMMAFTGYAQWPSIVHDPVNYGQLGMLFEQGVEQVMKIEEQISFLQDAKTALTVVSQTFKSLNTVEKTLDLSRATISQIESVKNQIGGMKGDPAYISASAGYCMRQIKSATDNVTLLISILTDNSLRLNDSERLQQVQQAMATMGNLSNDVSRHLRQMNRIEKKANALKCF